jgi:hypothetical protein
VVVGEVLTAAAAGKVLLDPQGGAAQIMKWTMAGIIPDPGNGNDIDVTRSGTCNLEMSGAGEDRDLPIPTFIGQSLVIYCGVHGGGDLDVDATAPFNVANHTKLRFAAVSQACGLTAVTSAGAGSSLVWQLMWTDGVATS